MKRNSESDDQSRTYKQALIECLDMRKLGGRSAYRRTKMLVRVFYDQDFRADNGCVDDFKLAGILDGYIEDTALKFLEAKALLEFFPRKSQWSPGRLRTMVDEMAKAHATERSRQREQQKAEKQRAMQQAERTTERTTSQCEPAANNEVRHEPPVHRDDLHQARQRIADLEQENSVLRRENESLRSRISELRKLLSAETAAA